MQPKLPELFTYIPGAPVTVEPIPAFQAAMATHYQSGTPDGKRPGRVSVAVSDATHRSLVDDEAVAYHEGIPGHHMQISVAQTLTGLPKFRLHSGNSGYVEGWALYAEQLGKEVGFYQDPVSDYGRLSSELFRAVRLVVDTGIHSQGWSRDQAVQFMRETGAVDEPTIQAEVDRYIAWPGRRSATSSASSSSASCATARRRPNSAPPLTSAPSTTRCSPAARCPSTCSTPAPTPGSQPRSSNPNPSTPANSATHHCALGVFLCEPCVSAVAVACSSSARLRSRCELCDKVVAVDCSSSKLNLSKLSKATLVASRPNSCQAPPIRKIGLTPSS
jgi:hypothetical protein